MNGYYKIIDGLRAEILANGFVNTVTHGILDDVDLVKQTIFPLWHIIVNSCVPDERVLNFNVSIIAMDIVDKSKSVATNATSTYPFGQNDNEQDVLNTQLALLIKLYESLLRGSLDDTGMSLESVEIFEPFTERFENYLSGWTGTFNIIIANDVTKC